MADAAYLEFIGQLGISSQHDVHVYILPADLNGTQVVSLRLAQISQYGSTDTAAERRMCNAQNRTDRPDFPAGPELHRRRFRQNRTCLQHRACKALQRRAVVGSW